MVNRHGTLTDSQGYVLCQVCRKPVPEISKDTAPAYAKCRQHGQWAVNDALSRTPD